MASTTSKTQRAITLLLAIVFIVSTIGVVVFSVMSANQQDQDAALQQQVQNAINEQQVQPQEGKMAGSPLANFTPIAQIDTLGIIDTVVGTGDEAKAGDTVTAHYTGAVAATGIVFQSSHDSGSPIPFSLDQVIEGWSKGVPGMKVGGTRRLLIPASMAYGANAPQGSGIPANADLVFDVELVKIGQ